MIPSFVETLRRCHSTVRALMNGWAPISGFRQAVAGEPSDLEPHRREGWVGLDWPWELSRGQLLDLTRAQV